MPTNFFVANTALKFWTKNSVMSAIIQDSLTRQQFSMIKSILYKVSKSPAVFRNVRIAVLNCPLFAFSNCCSQALCEFEDLAITSGVIKPICTNFTNFKNLVKLANFKHRSHEFTIYDRNRSLPSFSLPLQARF